MLRGISGKVKPPRALFLDRPLGYPLGAPHDRELQKKIIRQALTLLSRPVSVPLIVDFQE